MPTQIYCKKKLEFEEIRTFHFVMKELEVLDKSKNIAIQKEAIIILALIHSFQFK